MTGTIKRSTRLGLCIPVQSYTCYYSLSLVFLDPDVERFLQYWGSDESQVLLITSEQV